MSKSLSILMCLSLCLLFLPNSPARANEGVANIWQMDYDEWACSMVLEAAANCTLCHTTPPEVNPYGQDIKDWGFAWFVIEPLDSDGDGRTNAEEITNDCSLPGDAASPTEAATWSWIKAVYRK